MKQRRLSGNRSAISRSFVWQLFGLFAVALALRVFHLLQIHQAPFSEVTLGDGTAYHIWAQRIAAGDWLGSEVFYQAPLYPYFLGIMYSVFGVDLLAARIVQALVSSLSCVFLALAGRRLFSEPVGSLAGLTLALYAPAIFLDGVIQKSVVELFFLCLLIWLLSGAMVNPRRSAFWWTGVSMGCLILARENALVYIPVIIVWLFVHFRNLGNRRIVLGGLFALGLTVVLLPVGVRNKVVGGEFHLTTSQFGPNLYIGNNEDSDGTYKPLRFGRGDPRVERQDAVELAERATGRRLSPSEVSDFWTHRALTYISLQPGDWLKLMARKFALVWNATEILDTEDQYTYADWSIPLRLTGYLCHFGVIAPLGLLGIWLTRRERCRLWLFYSMFAVYLATVVLFCVYGRYRYPLVPFLVLFAAAGIARIRSTFRESSGLQIAGYVGAIVVVAVFCNWPITPKQWMRSTTYCNFGEGLNVLGKSSDAVFYFKRALEITPRFPQAHAYLGMVLASEGRVEEGMEHFRKAIQLKPEFVEARWRLGNALREQGKTEEAIEEFGRTLQIDPDCTEAHEGLGIALASTGRLEEAIQHFRRSLEIAPNDPRAHYNMGTALANQGDLDGAKEHLIETLKIDPDHLGAHFNLGNALVGLGDLDGGMEHYRQAIRIDPDHAIAHYFLGNALRKIGRTDECLAHYEEALRVKPDWPAVLNSTAWILSTDPDSSIREPGKAVRLARRAVELTMNRDPYYLDTLAAAYAAAAEYDRAMATAEEALRLASRVHADALVDQIRNALKLYRQSRPYRMVLPTENPD